jgi:hypothetical protein
MSNPRDEDRDENRTGTVHRANPENAAVDPHAAAQQEQVKADRDALRDTARRLESTPTEQGSEPATDPAAAAKQDQVRADTAAIEESARRVQSSVSAEVRDTPIQPASEARDAGRDPNRR